MQEQNAPSVPAAHRYSFVGDEDYDPNAGEVFFDDEDAGVPQQASAAAAAAALRTHAAARAAAYDSDTDSAASRGASDRLLVSRPPPRGADGRGGNDANARARDGGGRGNQQSGAGGEGDDDDAVPLDALAGGVDVLGAGEHDGDVETRSGADAHTYGPTDASPRALPERKQGRARQEAASAWDVLEREVARLSGVGGAPQVMPLARRAGHDREHHSASDSEADAVDGRQASSSREHSADLEGVSNDREVEADDVGGGSGSADASAEEPGSEFPSGSPSGSSEDAALSADASVDNDGVSDDGDRDIPADGAEGEVSGELSDWDRLMALAAGHDIDADAEGAGAGAETDTVAQIGDEGANAEVAGATEAPGSELAQAAADAAHMHTAMGAGTPQAEQTAAPDDADMLESGDEDAGDAGLEAGLQELQEALLAERAAAAKERKAGKKRKRKTADPAGPQTDSTADHGVLPDGDETGERGRCEPLCLMLLLLQGV